MGARPCLAKLAYVLSRRALYRIRADRRAGLVFGDASALSSGRACDPYAGFAPNADADPYAPAYMDASAHTHAASDVYTIAHTFPDHHAHSNRNLVALLYTPHRSPMKKLFFCVGQSATQSRSGS